ncbi:MAG: metal-dependent hydrolase [Ardenticatenaceae bacterium]|nr:metal-dependent hydrolase [Ardenticatenaceae bacterium]
MIIGHLAAAVIIKHFSPGEKNPALLAGSIFPDVGDKTIKAVRGLKEGRSFFHSLFGSAITLTTAFLLLSSKNYRSFLIGYIGHILVDAQHDVPWLYPFRDHQFGFVPYSYLRKVKRLTTQPKFWETLVTFWAIFILLDDAWKMLKNATIPGRDQDGTAAIP